MCPAQLWWAATTFSLQACCPITAGAGRLYEFTGVRDQANGRCRFRLAAAAALECQHVHEAVFREAALNKVKRPARAAERCRSSPHALAAAPELFRAFLYDAAGRIHA